MGFKKGGDSSRNEAFSNPEKESEEYQEYSEEQIEKLEAFFKDCPHPTENQQLQLSMELGLSTEEVKFWFEEYKKNQIEAQKEREENDALRAENEKLRAQNDALKGILKGAFCTNCNVKLSNADKETKQLHLRGSCCASNSKKKKSMKD